MPNINIQATEADGRRINEFISALRTPCSTIMHPESSFNSQAFESEFRSKLLTHHCFMGSPLYMESFDSAFVAACRCAGYRVEFAPEGQRFWDIELDNRKISLKSSKAQSLRENKLHISKLTEAAWIQDCRNASTRQQRTFELFNNYCNEVDSIIQLRYFKRQNKYELVEFPVRLFNPILDLDRSHFSTDGPTINIPIGADPPDFTLKIDRSDAKITIANINKERCLVHGTWQL